jgi:hypothetical protein
MKIDYQSLTDALDQRIVDLKRFEGQYHTVGHSLFALKELVTDLEDLYICFNELDADAKKALPDRISMLMQTENFVRGLNMFLGTADSLGFKDLFEERAE